MTDELSQLKRAVDALSDLPESVWEQFSSLWQPFTARRKEVITATGEVERYLYFVVEGVQRVFYLDDRNREATLILTYAPSFGGVLDSFLLQKPSRYYYETLTPSHFIRASYEAVSSLMREQPSVTAFVQRGVTSSLSGLLERMVELQSFSSEEKFRTLLKRSPHILKLIPHKYLANYLGMDATNFSKLMNSVKI